MATRDEGGAQREPIDAAERRRANGRAHATTVGPWEIALLAVVAIIAVLYVVAAAKVTEISTNDGAYYYGVARHMSRTGRFEEPIVFHFMQPPPRIPRTPSYRWPCSPEPWDST